MGEWVGGWVGGWVSEWVRGWVGEWVSGSDPATFLLLRFFHIYKAPE